METIHQGKELDIGGVKVAIPLKYSGPVTANNQSALNWFEWYRLNVITGSRNNTAQSITLVNNATFDRFTKPMDNVGSKTFPDYEAYANQFIYDINIPGCGTPGRAFAGQRQESFSVNLGQIFDLINFVPIPGFPGAIENDETHDDLRFKNVGTIALEVLYQCLSVLFRRI